MICNVSSCCVLIPERKRTKKFISTV
jgi:hypothetical protein